MIGLALLIIGIGIGVVALVELVKGFIRWLEEFRLENAWRRGLTNNKKSQPPWEYVHVGNLVYIFDTETGKRLAVVRNPNMREA